MHRIHFHLDGADAAHLQGDLRIPEGTPLIIDDDLLFQDSDKNRPSWIVNAWIINRSHEPRISTRTLNIYLGALLAWLVFLRRNGFELLGDRASLQAALGLYADFQLSGKCKRRWANSTWDLNITCISEFYKWAISENYAKATPFTYAEITVWRDEIPVVVLQNNAKLPIPKGHSTIKYLGEEYQRILLNTLEGLSPDGSQPAKTKARNLARNSLLTRLLITTGLRSQELNFLTSYELPHLPQERTDMPIEFFIPGTITKRGRPRTTWIDFDTLMQAKEYLQWERRIAASRSTWTPKAKTGGPLHVEGADTLGAIIDGERRSWSEVTLEERARLVAPEGGSCLLALQSNGAPFRALGTVLRRTAAQIALEFDEKFPHVRPHMLRHTFAMNTLERLVRGYYEAVARVSSRTNRNAALALYMTRQDPLMVLRDLLGHSSVTTTQLYLDRLDTRRIFADAFESAELDMHSGSEAIRDEVESEFLEEDG
ncbi:tyrosine-type recombinase/integrase [Arthrobacter sp. H-02-3]|uniref:tyrosine-type recombinase/integrase n=1 Tax=Arthrobacter sp. H-02-3 TaxID=2703675 RepID=UPI000E31C3C5|nr:site-specific integrase [Arthrobacter sp. H-02-3]